MPRRVAPGSRASETVTIRLTKAQRSLFDSTSRHLGLTVTQLLRALVEERAERLGLSVEQEPFAEHHGQGLEGESIEETLRPARARLAAPLSPHVSSDHKNTPGPGSLGALADSFRETFSQRGEGTRRELEEALRFFLVESENGGGPILSSHMAAAEITAERLSAARNDVRRAPIRLSRKNLYLTYLRMLLHYGFKTGALALDAGPASELRPIAAFEVEEPWRATS